MRTKFFVSVAVLITFLSGAFFVPNSFADSKERDEIIKFIKQKKARWSARDTKISHFTSAERKKRLGSQIPTQITQEKILVTTSAAVPSQLDWRNYNGNSYVTPVKEQSDCSDCWAFASTAALESNKLISNNTPGVFLDLSEQTLNSCSGAGSCSGGYIDAAANFLRDIGLPLESCNPYTATDGMCSVSCSDWLINPYKISGWYKVNPAIEAIKYALYNYGPVVALMSVYTDYYYYSTGVYEYSWGSFEGYHAVLVVGYDDVEQCFIIKSSWGEDWGDAGYGKIAYSEVAGNSQFGFWTIAYENAIPTGFPTQDNIPRDPNNPNTTGQNGNSAAQLSILNGSVKDESGNAVSDAEIKIGNYKATSNVAGIYVFSSLPAGSYVATVSKSGYTTLSENLTITANDAVKKDFVISSSATSNTATDSENQLEEGIYGPGWIKLPGEHVTLEKAGEFFKARKEKMLAQASKKAPLAGVAADYETDEIRELAYALHYDPKLIYEYVHNNIDYVPYFGSIKGAQLTYLDGSGNDFDQASLMIALLRASSGKDANQTVYIAEYVYKFLNIPTENLANWFHIPTDFVPNILNKAYIPYGIASGGGGYIMPRSYVKLTVNNQVYYFDPAYKTYNNYDNDNKSPMSMSDFGTAMAYNRNTFLNVALSGATVEPNGYYVQNLNENRNETNIRTLLKTYTTNLANYLKTNYPNSDIRDVIGGYSIIPETLNAYPTAPPFPVMPVVDSQGNDISWIDSDVQDAYKSQIRVMVCQDYTSGACTPDYPNNAEIDMIFDTADLSGQRLTLTFNSSGYPELRLDGNLKATGTKVATSLSVIKMNTAIHHALATTQYIYHYQKHSLKSNGKYAVVYNFGDGVSDKRIQKRYNQLALYRSQQQPDTSEAVRGETLNILGQSYLKQFAMIHRMMGKLSNAINITYHGVGVTAEDSSGYFVNIGLNVADFVRYDGVAKKPLDITFGLIMSGLEHGILEQLMGPVENGKGTPAVSTTRLLKLANEKGQKIYLANKDNYQTVLVNSNFTNYINEPGCGSTSCPCSNSVCIFKNTIANQTDYDNMFILPQDGQLGFDNYQQWKGKGYVHKWTHTVNGFTVEGYLMVIGEDYYGGYNVTTDPIIISDLVWYTENKTETDPTAFSINTLIAIAPKYYSMEPVDMAGGSFIYENTDLALGGSMPLGLAFTRYYTSKNNLKKKTLGYGFDHNYNIYYTLASHAEPVLGGRQPLDAVGMMAALYVCADVLTAGDNIQNWMISALAANWGIEQLVDNAVSINMGNKVIEYIRLADDTYVPPPGITTQLIKNGDNTYSLKERFGTKMNFNAPDVNTTDGISIGKIYQIVDADENTATFEYNADKTLKKVTDAFGRNIQITYNDGNIASVSDYAPGSTTPLRTVSYSYDTTNNNLTSYTDAESKTWSYGYATSTNHLITSLTKPMTSTLNITTITNEYDALGRVKQQTAPRQNGNAIYKFYFSDYRNQEEDPNGKTITYYYDEKGREYSTENALGHKVTKTYDGQDHVISVTEPRSTTENPIVTNYEYDNNNNLKKVINALNQTVENFYDTQYRLIETIDALTHSVLYNYDTKHHLLGVTDAENNKVESSYYANGFKKTIRDPLGIVTTLNHDTYGNPLTSQTNAHPAITYAYDSIGRMTGLTDQVNSTTNFTYDKRNLLTSKTDPLLKSTTFTYYDNGLLHTKTDRNNQTITYAYTPTDKLATITYPDTSTVTFTYNTLDRMTYMQDAIGTASYVYDDAGRLTSMTDSNGFTIGYTYDANGNLTTLTYPGNKVVSYTYDALNRLKTVNINWLTQTATYDDYDAAGRLPGFTNFNSTTTSYSYDNANRLTNISNKKADATVISQYTFTLDGNGNRTNIVQSEPSAPVDDSGTIDYTYNVKKNRLTAAGATSFAYDDEGQLATGISAYTFDYEHRLKTIGGTNNQFFYDGGGNRLKAIRSGVETRYIYDAAGRLLAEADGSNNITKYYIYGSGLLATVTPANNLYCYHFNGVGSTIAITDSTQTVVNKYSYDVFGNIANKLEGTNLQNQPFTYVGQFGVMTEPNGFYYMKARYYDPAVGRFISEDPIGFGGGDVNLMTYVGNNPVTGIDPSGLWHVEIHGKRFAGLDSGWTMPYNPFSTHLHFTKMEDIAGPLAEAIRTGNEVDFVKYVHMGQDSFNPAHDNVLSHLWKSITGENPDDASSYPTERAAMQEWTKQQEQLWDQARANDLIESINAIDTSKLSIMGIGK